MADTSSYTIMNYLYTQAKHLSSAPTLLHSLLFCCPVMSWCGGAEAGGSVHAVHALVSTFLSSVLDTDALSHMTFRPHESADPRRTSLLLSAPGIPPSVCSHLLSLRCPSDNRPYYHSVPVELTSPLSPSTVPFSLTFWRTAELLFTVKLPIPGRHM